MLTGARGHENRDTRADACLVQATQAPGLGMEDPWTPGGSSSRIPPP